VADRSPLDPPAACSQPCGYEHCDPVIAGARSRRRPNCQPVPATQFGRLAFTAARCRRP